MTRAPTPRLQRRAFSLAEAVAAVGLLAAGVVSVLTAASAAVARRQDAQARGLASLLVSEVLEEARILPYQDASVATTVCGMEAGEAYVKRGAMDDVDDLNGWTENGIVDAAGNAVSGLSNWKRTVTVEWVDLATAATAQSSETGLKRVKVKVYLGARMLACGAILRSKAWSDAAP